MSDNNAVRHEALLLMRFASERLARSMLGKASQSRVRIVARRVEAAAVEQAEALTKSLAKGTP